MDLRHIITTLTSLPQNGTVFAERRGGEFRPDSLAAVVEMTDEELKRPVREVAALHAPGMEYFLEVNIILEIIEDWRNSHGGHEPLLEQVL